MLIHIRDNKWAFGRRRQSGNIDPETDCCFATLVRHLVIVSAGFVAVQLRDCDQNVIIEVNQADALAVGGDFDAIQRQLVIEWSRATEVDFETDHVAFWVDAVRHAFFDNGRS